LSEKFIKIPEFLMIFARKLKKNPEFYMIFARKKMPEFYIIIARKIFFQNLPSAPVSYAYMILTTVCMTGGSVGS